MGRASTPIKIVGATINLTVTSQDGYVVNSVSGWYFAHPESRFFAVAKINRDQVEDYAKRTGMTMTEAERWLSPNLGYDAE